MHRALELIGRRWTGVIVFVMTQGPKRFSDFREAIPDLSDRMLSERLKELEAEGLVRREVLQERPVQVRYHLTQIGHDLAPVFGAIGQWAQAWGQSQAGAQQTVAADGPEPKA